MELIEPIGAEKDVLYTVEIDNIYSLLFDIAGEKIILDLGEYRNPLRVRFRDVVQVITNENRVAILKMILLGAKKHDLMGSYTDVVYRTKESEVVYKEALYTDEQRFNLFDVIARADRVFSNYDSIHYTGF